MFNNDRNAFRNAFFSIWQKYQRKENLNAVESQIIAVVLQHPEYRDIFENSERYMEHEFDLNENPFLHMSLHLAAHEQLVMDKPTGIKAIYERLLLQVNDPHQVEHLIMTSMAEVLSEAQHNGVPPDESEYLAKLEELINK